MPTSQTHKKLPQERPSLTDAIVKWPAAPGPRKHAYVIEDDGGEYVRVEYEPELGLPVEYHDVDVIDLLDLYGNPVQKNVDENDQVEEAMRLTQDIRKAASHALPEILNGDVTYDDLIGLLQACEEEVVAARKRVEFLKEHTHKFNEHLYCIHCGYDGAS